MVQEQRTWSFWPEIWCGLAGSHFKSPIVAPSVRLSGSLWVQFLLSLPFSFSHSIFFPSIFLMWMIMAQSPTCDQAPEGLTFAPSTPTAVSWGWLWSQQQWKYPAAWRRRPALKSGSWVTSLRFFTDLEKLFLILWTIFLWCLICHPGQLHHAVCAPQAPSFMAVPSHSQACSLNGHLWRQVQALSGQVLVWAGHRASFCQVQPVHAEPLTYFSHVLCFLKHAT